MNLRTHFRWLAALAFALAASSSWGQAGATRVSGSLRLDDGTGIPATTQFTCQGEPVCTGTYTLQDQAQGCSNVTTFTDVLRISGLDLSKPGALTLATTFVNGDYSDNRNADGTCSIRPGTQRDFFFAIPATWDGTSGVIQFSFVDRTNPNKPPLVVTGGFTAVRPAPPAPVFPLTITGSITPQVASIQAQFQLRPQDVGTNPNVYVFALAPSSKVAKRAGAKDDPVQCVLAQLTATGTFAAVGASELQRALDAVVSSQGGAVNVLNNVPTPNVAGATTFVGYGSSPAAMFGSGTNRSAVTVPPTSPDDLVCQPQPPATGWWWNPAEDGRGFSVEVHGNNMFFAGFLYDASGRSTWYVATGPASMDGSYYTGPLYAARGGQTLGGAYPGLPQLTTAGTITLAFNSDRRGTIVWPGGTVPIQRFDIVAGGAADAPVDTHPESGWWWNTDESGRGFFMEWQRGTLDMAGYLYDDQGNSVWYLAWNTMAPNASVFNGNWWSFANGQTLTGAWKPNQRVSDNVAPVTVTFTSPTTATMTLPNGRTTTLTRHRF